jgi:hypothetical protein
LGRFHIVRDLLFHKDLPHNLALCLFSIYIIAEFLEKIKLLSSMNFMICVGTL